MFDKMFEAIARKQLQENAVDRFFRKLNNRHYRKIGAIVKFPNGTEGFDVVKAHAWTHKAFALYCVGTLGLGIAAGKLGSMKH